MDNFCSTVNNFGEKPILIKDGSISNADINGAANILRKAFPKVTQWDRGVVDTPCAVIVA